MKINKSFLMIVLVSSLVLSGCLPKSNVETVGNQEQAQGETFSGSLKDLMGMGKSVSCSWEYTDDQDGAKTTGVVYVDGKRSRSEIKVRVNDEGAELVNMDMISINDGEMGYMWNEGQTTGFKYNIAEMEKMGEEMQEGQNGGGQNQILNGWENIYNYECKNWRVDESKFSVPSNVEFTDMMAQMQQMQEQTENMKEDMKGVCDNLPEPQKSQCLEALE